MLRDLRKGTKQASPIILSNFKQQKEKIKTDGFNDIFKTLNAFKKRFFKKYNDKMLKKQANIIFSDTNNFNIGQQASLLNASTTSNLTKKVIARDIMLSTTSLPINSQKQVFTRQNVELIKSIPNKYFADIEQDINRITAQQGRASELSESIVKRYNTSKSKADLIARDQVSKLNGNLSQQRQQDADIELYEWSDSDDRRVRTKHSVMDGKICRWDNASVYADTTEEALAGSWKSRSSINGVELHPGQDYQCRCVALPIIT